MRKQSCATRHARARPLVKGTRECSTVQNGVTNRRMDGKVERTDRLTVRFETLIALIAVLNLVRNRVCKSTESRSLTLTPNTLCRKLASQAPLSRRSASVRPVERQPDSASGSDELSAGSVKSRRISKIASSGLAFTLLSTCGFSRTARDAHNFTLGASVWLRKRKGPSQDQQGSQPCTSVLPSSPIVRA